MRKSQDRTPHTTPGDCQIDLIRGLRKLHNELYHNHPGVWLSTTAQDLLNVVDTLQEHIEHNSYPHISLYWQPPLSGLDYKEGEGPEFPF